MIWKLYNGYWELRYRLYRCWRECRAALDRIEIQWRDGGLGPYLSYGPMYRRQVDGSLVKNPRTYARMEDEKTLFALLPNATILDIGVFLSGWDKGAEWASKQNAGQSSQGQ